MPNRSGKGLSLAKNADYGSIKNVTLHLNSKITLQVFVNHVKINRMTILIMFWVEFPFDDDFLGTKKLLLLMKKLTMTLIKQSQLPAGKLSTNEAFT